MHAEPSVSATTEPKAWPGFSAPVQSWFERRFGTPTEPQRLGWPEIAAGGDVLIAAPTGSGKTLAAFMVEIDRLVRRAMRGELSECLEVVYVSPLRALSHDIQSNLEIPLQEIRAEAARMGLDLPEIRAAVRTGDTLQRDRQRMLRHPPHILVTTPESLFLLLTTQRGRPMLSTVRTVIVDEIHAIARDKRGSHLALTLERLDELALSRPARVGLSATQRPIEVLARFLVGSRRSLAGGVPDCAVVDLGHQRNLDLAVEVPPKEDLQAVASKEQWDDLLESISTQVRQYRTTLIFVNTRRLAERIAHSLGESLGADAVAAHHGSLSRERRLRVEARLREGRLRALVATASLELGIDIGSVELVCQIGSPRAIATFLQRVGRSGHTLGLTPRGRLFPTTRDELVESAALLRAVRAGRLDAIHPPVAPLDILAQQIVAACACEEWEEDALFALVRGAAGFETLQAAEFESVIEMLARGFETPRGRRAAYLHRDRIRRRLRGRRGARIAALTSGGAIPETGDYRVVLDPDDTFIGTVDEDFAIESMAGNIFLLGTHSWKIRRVESGVVRVVDAGGAPPTIPFWVGEAPARTEELSHEVSTLRVDLARALASGLADATRMLEAECGLSPDGSRQLARYVSVQIDAIGRVPTCEDLVVERFFDESGGMQLVLHSPHGARINRGIGLALRKRFCRSFNQELQAAATDDAVILSLGSPQSFPLESLARFLSSSTVADVLEQALLGSPLFTARWRWNATRSLAVLRMRGGKRVPFALQRMNADDLLAAAFPEQTACQENVSFPIEIPSHPLVKQTLHDCLHEACDLPGLTALLGRLESAETRLHVIETVEPSPFAHEIVNARPYAFLDDAPLEERRARAVALRHVLPEEARDLARLEPTAIARVRAEALPVVRDSDEAYELLLDMVGLSTTDPLFPSEHFQELLDSGRTSFVRLSSGERIGFAVERLPEIRAMFPGAIASPVVDLPPELDSGALAPEQAIDTAMRSRLAVLGPVTAESLTASDRFPLDVDSVIASLARLEMRGIALRGRFDPELPGDQLCDRGLLARIHRYTIARLRSEIEPVSARDFCSFLLRWQHVHPDTRLMGEGGVLEVVEQLSGFEVAVAAWEAELLTTRVDGYRPEQLDALCLGGSVAWGRVVPSASDSYAPSSRLTPIALLLRVELDSLLNAALEQRRAAPKLRSGARRILSLLEERGALFSHELALGTSLLQGQVEEGLKVLIARGLVSCDGFAPLRRLLATGRAQRRRSRRGTPRIPAPDGRWSVLSPIAASLPIDERAERTAQRLLGRYGVVFRDLLAREWVPEGWREVHRALRRLEARGQVRGGRFVTGFTGEQFALEPAIRLLRRERRRRPEELELRVSAADPLNLAGILTPGPRFTAGPARWLVYRDGLPVAGVERGRRVELRTNEGVALADAR